MCVKVNPPRMTYMNIYSFILLLIELSFIPSVYCADDFSLCKPRISRADGEALLGNQTTPNIVSCPRPTDPPQFSACCYDNHFENKSVVEGFEPLSFVTFRCCAREPKPTLFTFASDQVSIVFAICLTVLLLLTTTITLICCFWSRCPLYMVCRIRYRQEDIIAYDSMEDETKMLNGMPSEHKKGLKIYAPNAVKITMLDED